MLFVQGSWKLSAFYCRNTFFEPCIFEVFMVKIWLLNLVLAF